MMSSFIIRLNRERRRILYSISAEEVEEVTGVQSEAVRRLESERSAAIRKLSSDKSKEIQTRNRVHLARLQKLKGQRGMENRAWTHEQLQSTSVIRPTFRILAILAL